MPGKGPGNQFETTPCQAASGGAQYNFSISGPLRKAAFFFAFILLMRPAHVFAIQVHAHPEGLYTHQLGHIFFLFSMAVFVYWLRKTRLSQVRGWRFIQVSCVVFILWNLGAMAGHEIESRLAGDAITGLSPGGALVVQKAVAPYLFYFLKMDHLFAVPAMILFLLGVNRLRKLHEDRP